MLQKLIIKNYIIIDEVELDLKSGLTCITGETGAGKSILLGALALILGKRADSSVHFHPKNKCVVEGHFSLSESNKLDDIFVANDLDFNQYSIIRRELLPGGRSRAFVNDTPVQLSVLQELAKKLIDVSSQRDAVQLSDSNFIYSVVDSYAGNEQRLSSFRNTLTDYQKIVSQLKQLKEKVASLENERSFVQLQYDELSNLNISDEGELEKVKNRLPLLENSENVKSVLFEILNSISTDDSSVDSKLSSAHADIQKIEDIHPNLTDFSNRIKEVLINLGEISSDISKFQDQFQFDAGELITLRDRLSVLFSALHKHKLNTLPELLALKESLANKLDFEHSNEELLAKLESKVASLKKELKTKANKIYSKRASIKTKLEKEITSLLKNLGLEETQFQFRLLEPIENFYNQNAGPALNILFSANKGVNTKEISKAASGGELSRVMLALKGSIAKKMHLPCLIFDEIDTGISGKTAKQTSLLLSEMATEHQLIAITHLPQIAAKANHQFLVEKLSDKDRSKTSIRPLSGDERISHIATMISGEMDSKAAIDQARELLNR